MGGKKEKEGRKEEKGEKTADNIINKRTARGEKIRRLRVNGAAILPFCVSKMRRPEATGAESTHVHFLPPHSFSFSSIKKGKKGEEKKRKALP